MGIFDSLFGEKTDATGPSQENSIKLSAEQQKLFDMALPFATKFADGPAKIYQGPTVAGFNTNDKAAQQAALGALPEINQAAGNALGAHSFLTDPGILSPDSNKYLAAHGKNISDELTRQWQQGGALTLKNDAVMSGGMYGGGNTRNMITDTVGSTQVNRNIGDQLTDLYSGAYGQGLDAMKAGLGYTPTVQAAQTYGAGVQSAVGEAQRSMQQAKMDADLAKFNANQNVNLSKAQDIINLVNGMPGATGVSSVTPGQPANDPIKNAIGLGASLLGSAFGG